MRSTKTSKKVKRRGSSAGRTDTGAKPGRAASTRPTTAAAQPAAGAEPAQSFPIVGFGASAGGLEALTRLLERLATDTGMAFVVVQHLDPTHRSILAELLAKSTAMKVLEVTEGMAVKPNHVYVIPPNKAMEVAHGVLKLTPRGAGHSSYRPIDTFLFSLAREQRNRAVGVILSGTASDGTLGLKAIKEEGGITFAQARDSAKFDGMPAAAIAGGAVDFIQAPEAIARELMDIARHPYVLSKQRSEREEARQFDGNRLDAIFVLLRAANGVDFTYYKQSTIRRRILRRMMLNRIDRLARYVEFLQQSPTEVTALYNDILINVTQFFRDAAVYEALATAVFPEIMRHRKGGAPIRIWVPGCAGGEEAYSIAMCLLEYFGDTGSPAQVQIFATDVSEAAVDKARAGIYAESSMAGVSQERQRRFFARLNGGYQVSKVVRDMCMFARQDLGKDPPFSRLDLISCRNVLIYLGPTLQKRIIPTFHYALKPDGFLVLGSSESIGSFADLFQMVDKEHRIYRKKPGISRVHLHGDQEFLAGHADLQHPGDAGGGGDVAHLEREADRMLLGRYAPPAVLINEAMNILHFRGQTGRYLEPAAGTASLNLMRMARAELQVALRKAVAEAVQRGAAVKIRDQRFRINGARCSVNIEVVPVTTVPVTQGRFFLVLFAEGGAGAAAEPARPLAAARKRRGKGEDPEIAKLRQELITTREYLQSVVEEQEAANEELRSANEEAQSTNEELQSINEELETAKEELQSTNEELTTINEELENVNQELAVANDDLKNLVDGVDIAIVMLGGDLRIRRFTPTAAALLNLIATDVGRPLGDLKPKIDAPDLEQWIVAVNATLAPQAHMVRGHDGRHYDLRIKPYRTADNKIDGAVMTIIERGGGLTSPPA